MDNSSTPSQEPEKRSRTPKRRCTCDSLGSGVCTDCAAIVRRRTDAEIRRMGGEVVEPGITKQTVYLVAHVNGGCADIAARLRAAAGLLEYNQVDLDGTARIVAGALARLDRLRDDQASIDGAA